MLSSYPPAAEVWMIRPRHFGFNTDTAATNAFQQAAVNPQLNQQACEEFDGVVAALSQSGIRVRVWDDHLVLNLPDAVFPNNWFSTHPDGTLVLYPMMAENRRAEYRPDMVKALQDEYGIVRTIDLRLLIKDSLFLEGTGSLCFDPLNLHVYAALSPRTHSKALQILAQHLALEPCCFTTQTEAGIPVYHTNVLLFVGRSIAVCCDNLLDPTQRPTLMNTLQTGGRQVLSISEAQMHSFAANILELSGYEGKPCLVLSQTALRAFRSHQKQILEQHYQLIPVNIPTIEQVGGGGVRCMLAEIFVPPKNAGSPL